MVWSFWPPVRSYFITPVNLQLIFGRLLSLALNAIFSDLVKQVSQQGRISMSDWEDTIIQQSKVSQFWDSPVNSAAAIVDAVEEQLVTQLFDEEGLTELGLMLAIKVLSRESNLIILHEQLADTTLRTIIDATLLAYGDKPVRALLMPLLFHLIDHHHLVSEHKGRERWLDKDGAEIRAAAVQRMALGFHSYRLPQLISLVKDLQLTEKDLDESQC